MSLLSINKLTVRIGSKAILRDVSLDLPKGKVFGLAGSSGAGKSMTALSIMGLMPREAHISGAICLDGEDLLGKTEAQMCALRGRHIAMVFQEPMTALNPLQSIGAQVAETVRVHHKTSRNEALEQAAYALERVGLPPSRVSLNRYPHDLSGGQRQRVVIAMAMVLKPKLLIADEPSTALDVMAQAQILDVLQNLVREDGMALLLITHDLAVMAQMTDALAIMHDGQIVESGHTPTLLRGFRHAYSKKMLKDAALKPLRKKRGRAAKKPVLEARNVVCRYALPRSRLLQKQGVFTAVDDVSFTVYQGQSVGLVGQSGCGKSTLLRALLALEAPQSGQIHLHETAFSSAGKKAIKSQRSHIQMVFQDPYGSFNPRHTVLRLVAEPFHLDGDKSTVPARKDAVVHMLEKVGLGASDIDKYPHQFSGGQRQRIAIARALITRPSLVALDEAVSALDVSTRAQVLQLLADLSDDLGVSFLFVSHDLSVVRAICDRVLVMQHGKIVEEGDVEDVFLRPKHPHTKALIAATPNIDTALDARKKLNS